MQQRIGFTSSPDCHHQSVGNELRGHGCVHRPANHAPREQIDDGRHIEPAFRRPDVSEVGNPFSVRRRRLEAAIEHVGSDGGGLHIRNAALLDQPNRFKIELACKLPPLHDPPPVPLKHLTRCLRNRVQAKALFSQPNTARQSLSTHWIPIVRSVSLPSNQDPSQFFGNQEQYGPRQSDERAHVRRERVAR
jgi:hypothetical protein